MSLHDLTGAELRELRKRITSGALKLYQRASEYTREQSRLPELRTIELVQRWQALRDAYAVAISAAQDQFELLEDIVQEQARRDLTALSGCTCEAIGTTGAHYQTCIWAEVR